MSLATFTPRRSPMGTLRIESAALYWAVIAEPPATAGLAGRMRRLLGSASEEEALRYAFEAWLPQPIEEVECRFARARGTRTGTGGLAIACGIDRRALERQLALAESAGRAIESAVPAALPECVLRRLPGAAAPEEPLAFALQFRSGVFESAGSRRQRRRAMFSLAAACALASGLGAIGLFRSASALSREAAAAHAAASALAARALGAEDGAATSGDPLAILRLAGHVAALERTRDRATDGLAARDRASTWLELLAAWPEEIPTRIEQVHVEQDTVTIRGEVRDASDLESLSLRLGEGFGPAGWAEQAKSGSKSRDAFAFSLIFRAAPSSPLDSAGSGDAISVAAPTRAGGEP